MSLSGPANIEAKRQDAGLEALLKARRLALRREYAEAAGQFEAARRQGAGYEALAGEALCLYKSGRVSEALSLAGQAAKAAPSEGEPHFIAGLALKDAGRYDEAVVEFDRAEALSYGRASARYHRAAAHFLAGRLAEAEADFETAAALLPDSIAVFHNLGVVRARRSRWKEAAAAFARCADLDPAGRPRYQSYMFEAGRAQAGEEFHFRGHRIKNMLALLADSARRSLESPDAADAPPRKLATVTDRLERRVRPDVRPPVVGQARAA